MIQSFQINSCGPLSHVSAQDLGALNLFIGPNSSGKTFLLKIKGSRFDLFRYDLFQSYLGHP